MTFFSNFCSKKLDLPSVEDLNKFGRKWKCNLKPNDLVDNKKIDEQLETLTPAMKSKYIRTLNKLAEKYPIIKKRTPPTVQHLPR